MPVFTKPINNAQMVDALNDLIRQNYDLMAGYNTALEQQSDADQRAQLEELKSMHERHVGLIIDRVRMLGGAPVGEDDRQHWMTQGKTMLARLGKDRDLWGAMQSNEEALREAYGKVIDEFKVSDEVVDLINQVLDDGRELRSRLAAAAGRGD